MGGPERDGLYYRKPTTANRIPLKTAIDFYDFVADVDKKDEADRIELAIELQSLINRTLRREGDERWKKVVGFIQSICSRIPRKN